MKAAKLQFIVVDDDPVSNMISKKVINKIVPNADVITFVEPEAGLSYLKSAYGKQDAGNAILFLDINMPSMTGWEFIEEFDRLGTTIKQKILIYILSSSVNPFDKEKAQINPGVVDYIEKPLSVSVVKSII